MPNPETQTVMQEELPKAAREARQSAGLTQQEAAKRLQVNQSGISKAENDPLGLQRRIIEGLAGWKLEGPPWRVSRSAGS